MGTFMVTPEQLRALIPRPYMHHHKMNEVAERDAQTHDRVRDNMASNVETLIATLLASEPFATTPPEGQSVEQRAGVTDAMVDAYLAAQAKAVQAVDDKWGNGGKAASYLHPVREACRAGLTAALSAQAPSEAVAIPTATDEQIAEWVERHDLGHAVRGTDARAAYEDAQSGHLIDAPQAADEARPKFMELDRVRYTNPHSVVAMATVSRAETRWDRDGKPWVFYTLRFEDGTRSQGIPQSAVEAPRAIDERALIASASGEG